MAVQLAPRIVVDAEIRFGKPIIEGTRVPVETVLARISGGMALDEVAAEFDLAQADVLAALAYAAQVIATKRSDWSHDAPL